MCVVIAAEYIRYAYHGLSGITSVAHPAVTGNLLLTYDPAGDGSFSALDPFGRVLEQKWTVNGQALDHYVYAYDLAGNRTARANLLLPASLNEQYTYDGLHRLASSQRGWGGTTHTESWSLDHLGNWSSFLASTNGVTLLDQSREHSLANAIMTTATTTGTPQWAPFTHDDAGNVALGPSGLDPTQQHAFRYDAWNRLVAVLASPGGENPDVLLATYRYNGLKHRVRKLLGASADTPTMAIDYYYNSDWQVIEERCAINSAEVGSPRMQYLWDHRYIDAPVCRWRDLDGFTQTIAGWGTGNGSLEETLYYCNDANMNITAMVNTAGAVLERYVYSPYGQVSFRQADWTEVPDGPDANTLPGDESAAFNTILYCGYRYDAEANHYHVRHRVYRPDVGRWWQRDPAGYVDGGGLGSRTGYVDGMNVYQYVRSTPCNYSDPTGQITLGMKIRATLGWRMAKGGVGAGFGNWIWNPIFGKTYTYQDDEDEMSRAQGGVGFKMNEFYKAFLDKQNIRGGWQDVDIPLQSAVNLAKPFHVASTRFMTTYWWLNGAHDVKVKGRLTVCKMGSGYIVKDLQAKWEWHDEIDGRTYDEMIAQGENTASIVLEGTYDKIYDKALQTNFDIVIHWDDKVQSAKIPDGPTRR